MTDGEAERFFDALPALPHTVVMVVGLLGDQPRSEADLDAARAVMATNYTGPACYLLAAARRMAIRGSGCIVGISSVAGDRGRQSNYVYGSAKAGFTAFLAGLRNRLFRQGVTVVTVKPGFVATAMTAGMKLPPLLTAQPDEVGQAIFAAVTKGKDTIYVRAGLAADHGGDPDRAGNGVQANVPVRQRRTDRIHFRRRRTGCHLLRFDIARPGRSILD